MNRYTKFLILFCIALLLSACGGQSGCLDLRCPDGDASCRQPLPKHDYQPPKNPDGTTPAKIKLGTIGYLVMSITDVVRETSQKVFEKITGDNSFKTTVTALMTLFVVIYGITIALGIAQPNAMELVIRIVKMAIIFFLLTSWANFQEIVVSFFESLTNELTTIMTSAVTSVASGTNTKVTAMDVFNFIDEQVLGLLLSVRFATIIGAIMTSGGIGIIIALMLASTVLSYLWTVVISVQIFIMAAIGRALLYAISPIFLIFLLFKQTTPLFDGWLKQLINFSLQPVFLISFMAFFNGVFFNYIDTMFDDNYEVCYDSADGKTSGQTFTLSGFTINDKVKKIKDVPLTQALDIFTLFVVIMLGTIMVKMNQWAVQAAQQLSEGGIGFTQTMQSNSKMVQSGTKTFGDEGRKLFNIEQKK